MLALLEMLKCEVYGLDMCGSYPRHALLYEERAIKASGRILCHELLVQRSVLSPLRFVEKKFQNEFQPSLLQPEIR